MRRIDDAANLQLLDVLQEDAANARQVERVGDAVHIGEGLIEDDANVIGDVRVAHLLQLAPSENRRGALVVDANAAAGELKRLCLHQRRLGTEEVHRRVVVFA